MWVVLAVKWPLPEVFLPALFSTEHSGTTDTCLKKSNFENKISKSFVSSIDLHTTSIAGSSSCPDSKNCVEMGNFQEKLGLFDSDLLLPFGVIFLGPKQGLKSIASENLSDFCHLLALPTSLPELKPLPQTSIKRMVCPQCGISKFYNLPSQMNFEDHPVLCSRWTCASI